MTSTVRVPVAEAVVDGRAVFVDPFNAPDGIRYECPECHGEVARHREGHERSDRSARVVRDPCFAHIADDFVVRTCRGGTGESHQHRQAKMMAANAIAAWCDGRGPQPGFVHLCACGSAPNRRSIERCDTVVVDTRVRDGKIGNLEPDVFVRHGDQTGAIEVCFRSPISETKIEAYRELSWWVELDAASILSGAIEWKVRRASWIGPCDACARIRAAKMSRNELAQFHEQQSRATDVDPQMLLRRQLAALPLDVRLGDVCPGCGLHAILDEVARLMFLTDGGSVECPRCRTTKTHAGAA